MKNESLVMSGAILVIVISVLSIFLGAIQPFARSQNFIEPYMEKDNLRHLMMTGQMYLNMWSAFKHDSDYETAINYYKQARKIGPNVYPVLFGLLSMYNTNGKVAEAKEVGTTILSIWPTDQDTINILSAYGK